MAVNKNAVKEMGMRAMLLDIKGPCSPKLPRLCKPMDRSTDFESLMREIRIVPYLINGNIEGFKIFAIQQDSYFRYLGFENGDVVLKINGHSVRSAETAIDQFKNLVSDSKPAKIRILRGIPAKNYPVN